MDAFSPDSRPSFPSNRPFARSNWHRPIAYSGLGHPNKCLTTQWIISACPDAQPISPYNVAVKEHREPHQAVTEGGYAAVETYHTAKTRTGLTDTGTERLVLAYDDLDEVGIIKAHE